MKPIFVLIAAASLVSAQLAPPNSEGVSMGHVHLNVRNIETQTSFWTQYFGAVPLKKEGLTGVRLPGMIILFTKKESKGGSQGTMMDHFGFKVPSTAQMVKRLRAAGVQVQAEFKGTEGFPNAYFVGPDEVRLEIQEDVSQTVPAIPNHVHFLNAAGDQIKLHDWYAKTFGAVGQKRGNIDASDLPGMNLTFGVSRNPPTIGTKGRAIDHIGFEVKNLEAFCAKLESNGIKLDAPYRKIPALGIAVAFLTDPFGTYVELTEGLDRY